MQPFDYRLAVQNPVQMALAGYQQGQQMVGQREEAAMNRQLFEMKAQEFELNKQKLAQEQARAQEMQSALAGVAERVRLGQATARDMFEFNAAFPEAPEHITKAYEGMSQEQIDGSIKQLARTSIAFARAPEIGMSILERDLEAARNSGLTDAAAGIEAMIEEAKIDPAAAITAGFSTLSVLMEPDKFESFIATAMPQNKETEAFQTLRLRAAAAGLQEGTPEYRDFMKQGGADRGPLVQNVVGGEMSPGFKAMDQAFAPIAVEWRTGGGADALAQIAKIEDVIGRVDRGENISGGVTGFAPDLLRAIVDPNAQDAKETVEDVVQRNLRVILGAQFTAAEGERLVARAFNPRLSPEVNRKRLQRLFTQMRLAAQQKEEMVNFFTTNGTLIGFKGRQPSLNDFYDAIEGIGAEEQTASEITRKQIIQQLPE